VRGVAFVLVAAGCHVVARTETLRPSQLERIPHRDQPRPGPPALVLTGTGELRFVETLACPTEELVATTGTVEVATRPNLATFVVGVIATSAGGVLLAQSIGNGELDPAGGAGMAFLAGGLPLAIGPWLGNGTRLEPGPQRPPERRPGPNEPCGERPLVVSGAVVHMDPGSLEVRGAIDANGTFEVSPFAVADAFYAHTFGSLELRATLDDGRTIIGTIDGGALTRAAPAFLAKAGIDARVEPMQLVPDLSGGTLRARLDTGAVTLVLALHNAGPGPAWAVRGRVIAHEVPAIDGRVMYIGAMAKGATITRELVIPMPAAAAAALHGTTVDIAIELQDAHRTAPATPVRYRGPL
jgi:hypothetical protein